MTVSRILNQKGWNVFTVHPTAPLQAVILSLAEHHVGVLVVTETGRDVAGIISERDVIRALAASATAAERLTAADVMTRGVATCAPDDPESEVMEHMTAAGVRHLPVLAGGKLAGSVSIRDVVKLRLEKIDEMMRSIRHEAELASAHLPRA